MEVENEGSPLLHSTSNIPKRKNICRRIPTEVAITGIILGLFLIVVTLLIVLENLESTSDDALTLDNNLLASPLKYNKKPSNKYQKDDKSEKKGEEFINKKIDKVRNWVDKWKEAYQVDNFQDSLEKRVEAEKEFLELLNSFQGSSDKPLTENDLLDILEEAYGSNPTTDANILGSPFKYNKKALDQTWQDKKKEYVKSKLNRKLEFLTNFDKEGGIKPNFHSGNVLDSPGKSPDASIDLLGSPFKYNKKALDKTWQEKKDMVKPDGSFNSKKWDNVNKGWKKIFPFDSPSASKKEAINNNLLSAPAKDDVQQGSMKWDKVNKEWKKISNFGDKTLKEMQEFSDAWEAAENKLKSEMNLYYEKQKEMDSDGKMFSNRSVAVPSGCPFGSSAQAPAVPKSLVNCALMAEQVRRDLGRCIDMSFLPKECKPSWRNKCFSIYKYRKIDGTCNNQVHPTWGKSGTSFVRMVAPDYSDGVSSIRTAKNGGELPNPRLLSQNLYSKKLKPDSHVTLLFMSYGLIVDHDLVETAINTDGIPCCSERFDKYPQARPKECLQIDVPDDDPFYGPRNVKCLNFVRSIPVHGECGGRREQLNKATSFLDGSAIYGSNIQKTKTLRSFNKGQLRTERINNTPYMAFTESTGYSCGTPSEPLKCFEAGDSRVNMLVELMAMHTLWYREHNRLAEALSKINPQWSDEAIFQEARRILIAELQHITYDEYLPLLLGTEAMNFFGLNIEPNEYYDGYDETIDPSVFNVFGAAAFRFGHSLIQDMVDLVGADNKTEGSVALHETFFNPQLLYHKGLDHLLRGATSQKMHSVDSFISEEVRQHLFQPPDKDFGHDLAAVSIQRGRDHGLPPYNKWRSVCGLSETKSWDDLNFIMNVERANKLKEMYQSVDDIDLIPGALAEDSVEGSLLGPTYTCILGRQFKKTRKGDRFWYEMEGSVGSFTKDQLNEIYNSNMARIICDNSDGITKIQKYPFMIQSEKNPVVNCDEIPKVDLSKWNAYY